MYKKLSTEANCFIGDYTKSTEQNLQNCKYKSKSTKQNVLIVKGQTYLTKFTPLNPPNKFYQTKSRERNLQEIKVQSNPSLYWA